jgi:DNA-directed RNA polymerase subunit RPC12/RpoP
MSDYICQWCGDYAVRSRLLDDYWCPTCRSHDLIEKLPDDDETPSPSQLFAFKANFYPKDIEVVAKAARDSHPLYAEKPHQED